MSVTYRLLYTLYAEHQFFDDTKAFAVSFAPTESCAAAAELENILFRSEGSRLELYGETIPDALSLRFEIYSEDPGFQFYTEDFSPERILYYSSMIQDSGVLRSASLHPGEIPEEPVFQKRSSRGIRSFRKPAGIADIFLTGESDQGVIRFIARSVFWKYLIFDAGIHDSCAVVGVCRESESVTFSPERIEYPAGIVFTSSEPISMRFQHSQKLQLHDTKNGRVVVRRLPYPDYKRIGIIKTADGKNLAAAEIYPKL